ncbi:MAG: DUF424 family protein [Candidatus Woesearchaeota archaeon]
MSFMVKIHKAEGRIVLAVCDSDIFGKKFSEGNKQIDLSSDFYRGKIMDEDRVLSLMEASNSINLVGSKIVELAVKNGFVNQKNIIKINNIPIAFIVNESV